MGKGFFITGTKLSVGKTYVASLLEKKLNRQGFSTTYYVSSMSDAETAKAEYDKAIADNDCVIVEAAGDIDRDVLGTACVIVAETGDIENIAQVNEKMKAIGVPIKGVIYNRCHLGNMKEDNEIFMIERETGLRSIAKITVDAQEIDTEISEISYLFR